MTDPKEAARLIGAMSPKHLEVLALALEDPKRAIAALDLMIGRTEDRETRTRLLNVKHELEHFASAERK